MRNLGHYSSTAKHSKHDFCPKVKSCWYSFQCDNTTGSITYQPPNSPLTEHIIEVIMLVFKRLPNINLLEQCKKCGSQNANECFNSLVWQLLPQENFNSPMEMFPLQKLLLHYVNLKTDLNTQ